MLTSLTVKPRLASSSRMARPKKDTDRVQVTFRLPRQVAQSLSDFSTRVGITQNEIAVRAISSFIGQAVKRGYLSIDVDQPKPDV